MSNRRDVLSLSLKEGHEWEKNLVTRIGKFQRKPEDRLEPIFRGRLDNESLFVTYINAGEVTKCLRRPRMARKRRIKDGNDESSPPKKAKTSPATRQTRSKAITDGESTSRKGASATRRRQSTMKIDTDAEGLSDSSSLSEPPSVIAAPSPLRPLSPKGSKKATKRKPAQNKKITPKEQEEALNLFIRDDSDEEGASDDSSLNEKPNVTKAKGQANGVVDTEDEEEEDWEDVDLSHKRQVSLGDLINSEEPPNLEVTLERNQQSMRIK